MSYAYETLALAAFSPIGPSISIKRPIRATATPMYVLQSVPQAGLGGIIAGQIAHQPLFNPLVGYSGNPPYTTPVAPRNVSDPSQMMGAL